MSYSTWLSNEQLRELLDRYFSGAYHEDDWPRRLKKLIEEVQAQVFNLEALDVLSDEALVERALNLYREIVAVPMYYKAITKHPDLVRGALRYLLESKDDPEAKVNALRMSDGDYYIKGLGKTFWSLFFMALDPSQNPYWNNKTEKALGALGMARWTGRNTPGQVYGQVAEAECYLLKLHPQADLYTIDHFMHYVTALEGKDILERWKGKQARSVKPKLDDLSRRIKRWQEEHLSAERIDVRQEAEGEARDLLEQNLGQFDEETLSQFFELANTDSFAGQPRRNRFSPAFVGAYLNRIAEQLDVFNEWAVRLWKTPDEELESVLDAFWEQKPISYAGTSLPTLLLYLRDPSRYNIWLQPTANGLEHLTGFKVGRESGANYFRYNEVVNKLKEDYGLEPQELDVIFVIANRETAVPTETPPRRVVPDHFDGFSPDTFKFLNDLRENNTKEWLDANRERYKHVLREPLRSLFKDVAPVVAALDPNLETEAKYGKVLASIKKRWPDDIGPYYSHLWGAFCRADLTKQTDAQLFVIVHPSHIAVGLGAGISAKLVIERFRHNVQTQAGQFYQLLRPLLDNGLVVTVAEEHTAEKETLNITSVADLQHLIEFDRVNIERQYGPDQEIVYQPEFVTEVGEIFESLYPLYRFFVSEDIVTELPELLVAEEEEEIEEEGEEKYTFEELQTDTFLDVSYLQKMEVLIRDKGQIILYGPPGTGKTYVAKKFARHFVDQTGGEVRIVQFHPSYSYEEFIEGIRPESDEGQLTYPVKQGMFRRLCEEARRSPSKRYVLIVDEINRGSLPRIFGELLYLLEYRDSQERVTLPYSGERFSIPRNVYLIGTMNTADRSIALVDHALRRRFYFVDLKPSPEILQAWLEGHGKETMVWVADLLKRVNSQLSQDQIDWHLHIGHSYFMVQDGELNEERVALVWYHAIEPMLEEYFYKRPDKIARYSYESLKSSVTAME